jgi:hypothetical protein
VPEYSERDRYCDSEQQPCSASTPRSVGIALNCIIGGTDRNTDDSIGIFAGLLGANVKAAAEAARTRNGCAGHPLCPATQA